MKTAPKLLNEKERIKSLYEYQILDTEPQPQFDAITELAAKVCGTDICLISLVDQDRQWFKSKKGMDVCESPRDISFCGHAIEHDELFIVEDALKDERFYDNPYVAKEPKIRFYAGAPLVTPQGQRIGTLCVVHNQPKQLTDTQKLTLTLLASNVVHLLELDLKNRNLQDSRNLMDEFQRTAKIGGWELDLETKNTVWTREIYNIYAIPEGTPTDEAQGLSQYLEPSLAKLEGLIQECATKGTPFDDFFQFKDATGNIKWLHNIGRLINDEKGPKIVGTTQDVTEHIQKENEIVKQKQFLADTINNSPANFYTRSLNGDILMMNSKFKNFHNMKTQAHLILPDTQVFLKENYETMVNLDKKVIETGKVVETEDTLIDQNETKRVFNSLRFPYRDINGNIYATGCISIDITNKKILESQSLHRAKLASIGEMAAGAGHEINNPLAIIIGYVSKLKKLNASNELTSEVLSTVLDGISKSAFRISKIVSGIRSFSRYDSEGTVDFDIVESIRESTHMVQEIYDVEGVTIEFLTNLPSNRLYVNGNRGQIQQVIINLISNAKDATSRVAEPKILVSCKQVEDEIYITVQDNGSGIPEDIQSRIFDPFFTTKSAEKGTGIGLSLVNKLISDHDGSIQVESEIEMGTTFTIRLPIKELSLQAPSPSPFDPIEHLTPQSPKKILLIDDEPEIRELLRESLVLFGYDVTPMENGKQGLEICHEKPNYFDLVLCDIRMPEMDGYKFLMEFQKFKQTKRPKFVFITGGVNLELTAPMKNIENKVDGFLYKPFDHQQLLELLKNIFEENTEKTAAS